MGLRVLVVGASSSPTCGLRDYARAVEPGLAARSASLETLWWERDPAWSAAAARRSVTRFLRRLEQRLADHPPEIVIWHYSVFEYGSRTAWDLTALPIHAPRFARALGGRLLVVIHEFAYGSAQVGWQRKLLAASHRAALTEVLRRADGAVVAVGERERWLRSRRWLPRRPLAVIPVCATVTPPGSPPCYARPGLTIGVFGFGADDARPELMLETLRTLRERGHDVRLLLLGAPGPDGPRVERWRAAACAAGSERWLEFSGVVDDERLASALAGVDLVTFPIAGGCGAGKTTLASALAFAKPTVVLDGPGGWPEAIEAGAIATVAPDRRSLADRLDLLLGDERERARQGAAGRSFYELEMAPEVVADRLATFVVTLAPGRR